MEVAGIAVRVAGTLKVGVVVSVIRTNLGRQDVTQNSKTTPQASTSILLMDSIPDRLDSNLCPLKQPGV